MKKNLKNLTVLSLIGGSLFMFSCRDNPQKTDEPAEPMQNEMRQENQADIIDEGTNAEFRKEKTASIYEYYISIKDALVNTDALAAQDNAEALSLELEGISPPEQVLSAARAIAMTSDVNEQREAFSRLTLAMEPLLEDGLVSGEIYKQYCPMAFEGKGDYWYSNSKQIRNPYYGDKMLNCGRVEQTIN